MSRRYIAGGFIVNFLLLWGISASVYLDRFDATDAALIAPIAPFVYGYRCISDHNPCLAICSLSVIFVTIMSMATGIRKNQRISYAVLAHLWIIIYWMWSFFLIGSRV